MKTIYAVKIMKTIYAVKMISLNGVGWHSAWHDKDKADRQAELRNRFHGPQYQYEVVEIANAQLYRNGWGRLSWKSDEKRNFFMEIC